MRALILDGDGATLVMGRRHWGLVRESGLDHLVEVAPHGWRAFEVRCLVGFGSANGGLYAMVCKKMHASIRLPSPTPTPSPTYTPPPPQFNLGHMVAEVPGVVNHLAKLMADDNISVLHHSTYGSGAW